LGRIDRVGALLAMVVGVLLEEALLEGVVVFDAVVLVLEVLLEPIEGVLAAVVLDPLVDLSTPVLLAAAGYCGVEPVGGGVFDWVVVDCA